MEIHKTKFMGKGSRTIFEAARDIVRRENFTFKTKVMSNTDGEDTATKDRIEKDATTVLELTKGFTPEQRKEMGNMLTSLEEMAGNVQILCQKLKQERNKAIEALEKHHDSIEKGDEYSKGVANCINILYSLFKDKSDK